MLVYPSEMLQERRGPLRVPLRERVWCTFQGKTMRCESENLSTTGLQLAAPRYLPPGTRVELKPDHASPLVGRRRLCARVVWAQPESTQPPGSPVPGWDARLGLEFCEPAGFEGSWAASALRSAVRTHRPQARRTRRHGQQLEVSLLTPERQLLGQGVTVDLSLGGLGLTTAVRCEAGQVLVVAIPVIHRSEPLELAARVVGQQADRLHLRFFTLNAAQRRELTRCLGSRVSWWGRLVGKLFA